MINSTDTVVQEIAPFTEIVRSRQSLVFNTALGIVQNEGDAEDIAQEVFVKVFQNLSHFRGDADLSTWIYRITITTALDHEKQKKRAKRGGLLKRVFGDDAAAQIPDFDHPGIALEKKEDAKVLFNALKQLPDNQRAAFILNKLEGLSNRQVADILQLSLQAVESLQVRAKSNLRSILKNYYEKHFK